MTRATYLLLTTLLMATPCLAQEAPAWEFFAGYSFQRADVREYYKSSTRPIIIYAARHHYVNMNGWEASITENRNRWFGGTFDISGYYKSPQVINTSNREQIHSILYGPRFSYRRPYGTPFAHILFGAAHTSVSAVPTGPHPSDWSFATALGVGFDMTLKNNAAIRVLQADYLRTNALGSGQNNFRLSAGLVFRFGAAK